MNMTIPAAESWCNDHKQCHGFTVLTSERNKPDPVLIYFRDETQIFFMDSELSALTGPVGASQYTSFIKKARAPPLSPTTSGLQIWVKDLTGYSGAGTGGVVNSDKCGGNGELTPALAVLLVNLGQSRASDLSLGIAELPSYFTRGFDVFSCAVAVRDIWNHRDVSPALTPGKSIKFGTVAPHDSVFYVLRPQAA